MKTFIQTTIILFACLHVINSNGQRVTPKMDQYIHSLTVVKEDKRFVWAQSALGVVRINKRTYKTWLVSPKVIALPSPIVTGLVNDGKITYVSTTKGIVYDNGWCTVNMTTDNTALPENNIIDMKWGCGGLLIKTKHYGWYLATGNPNKTYRMKKMDAKMKEECNVDVTSI